MTRTADASRSTLPLDLLVGAGLALSAAVISLAVVPVWVQGAPYDAGWAQSPRLFPWLSLSAIGLLGLIIAWRGWRQRVKPDGPLVQGTEREGLAAGAALRSVALVLTSIGACVWAAGYIGMITSGIAMCMILMLLAQERRVLVLLLAGVIVPAGIIQLLKVVGSVPMPVGAFGF